jgi:flavin-dependent dehydrogenase
MMRRSQTRGSALASARFFQLCCMSKSVSVQPDVLVLGSHPCCYFAAALLQESNVRVVHATIPDEPLEDRLTLLNPAIFDVHKLMAGMKTKVPMVAIHGLRFLADDPTVASEHAGKAVLGYIAMLRLVRQFMIEQAAKLKVELVASKQVQIQHVDEGGAQVSLNGKQPVRPRLLIVGGELPEPQKRMLGIPDSWESGVLHRYTYLKLKGTKCLEPGSSTASAKPVIPMSLDLSGQLFWAWLLPGPSELQIAVEQPVATVSEHPSKELLQHWIDVLIAHKVLKPAVKQFDLSLAESIDLPLAGALSQEGVANRTLLIGPAAGFYTACAEDIYPNTWSAVFAADVARKAIRERHVQDALGAYREKWGSTLGDYLRGPQQNLRFLLPLVYRNPVMTARLTEAILSGVSVVR